MEDNLTLVEETKELFDAKGVEFLRKYLESDSPKQDRLMTMEGYHGTLFHQQLDSLSREICDLRISGLIYIFVAETVVKFTIARYDNAIVEMRREALYLPMVDEAMVAPLPDQTSDLPEVDDKTVS